MSVPKDKLVAYKKLFADPRLNALGTESGAIFDCKRMAYGGFKTLVQW